MFKIIISTLKGCSRLNLILDSYSSTDKKLKHHFVMSAAVMANVKERFTFRAFEKIHLSSLYNKKRVVECKELRNNERKTLDSTGTSCTDATTMIIAFDQRDTCYFF